MNFYDKINTLLRDKKITKSKLCEDLQIPYNSLMSMFNRKSKNITMDVIEKIAEYLDVSVDFLVKDSIIDPDFGKMSVQIDNIFQKKEHAALSNLMTNVEGIRSDTHEPGKLNNREEAIRFLLSLSPEADKDIDMLIDLLMHKYGKK